MMSAAYRWALLNDTSARGRVPVRREGEQPLASSHALSQPAFGSRSGHAVAFRFS